MKMRSCLISLSALLLLLCGSVHGSITAQGGGDGGIQDYTSNPYDPATYTNPNDTYVPSAEVEMGTRISPDDFQKSQDYFVTGAAIPIVLFGLGFLSLVCLNVCLCCGVSKVCAASASKHTVSCGEHCFAVIFFVFLVICFLATHVLYLGYGDTQDGFEIMRTSVTAVGDGFNDINAINKVMLNHSSTILQICSQNSQYGCLNSSSTLDSAVVYVQDDLSDIPDYVDWINDVIDMMEEFVLLCMFVMYGLLMTTILLYVFTQLCCRTHMVSAICCGNIAFFIVSLIGVVWMAATSITADFCYENPTVNTVNLMKTSKQQMYTAWYTSCYSGFNPLYRYINQTEYGAEAVMRSIGNDTSAGAMSIRAHNNDIINLLPNLTVATRDSCAPVQAGWLPLVNDGVCDSFFMGVRTIWICEVAACISLFFLMLVGAIMSRSSINERIAAHLPDDDDKADPEGQGDVEVAGVKKFSDEDIHNAEGGDNSMRLQD